MWLRFATNKSIGWPAPCGFKGTHSISFHCMCHLLYVFILHEINIYHLSSQIMYRILFYTPLMKYYHLGSVLIILPSYINHHLIIEVFVSFQIKVLLRAT